LPVAWLGSTMTGRWVFSFGCQGHFIGEGISGYLHAAAYLAQLLRLDGSAHTHLVM
jgi:3-dehydroquinate dehydratase II